MGAAKGNKYALGITTSGRPPVFESQKDLESKCIEYFEYCTSSSEKATITGFALFLGFESRQSVYDYKDNKEFSYTIKRACLAIEHSYEISASAFDIFALKNMGWKDRTETDLTTKGESLNKDPFKEIRSNNGIDEADG